MFKFSMALMFTSLALTVTPWFYPAAGLWLVWGVVSAVTRNDEDE